jgi:hypothetical protein
MNAFRRQGRCGVFILDGTHSSGSPNTYRGDTLCLRVNSIGRAARLEVNGEGTGFRPRPQPGRQGSTRPFKEAAE